MNITQEMKDTWAEWHTPEIIAEIPQAVKESSDDAREKTLNILYWCFEYWKSIK